MAFRPLLTRADCQARLQMIFPREAFDSSLMNPLAATAVAAMIYVDAVIDDYAPFDPTTICARPTTCLWMCDEAYAHDTPEERTAWRLAAARGRKKLQSLLESWGVNHKPWYGDNSREGLRDETFPHWMDHRAVRANPSVATTSNLPRWALTTSFADLFDPSIEGEDLRIAIEDWREAHMNPGDKLRIRIAQQRERQEYAVSVRMPDGRVRELAPGDASLILKGVIEDWAPARLADPIVLTVSEPGDKVYLADSPVLATLGLTIDTGTLLPDAVIVDIAQHPAAFWIVEAVASDGPITEDRKAALLEWADRQRIPRDACYFLTAFVSRHDRAARLRLKDLAVGTFAWYADEPARELAWYEFGGRHS